MGPRRAHTTMQVRCCCVCVRTAVERGFAPLGSAHVKRRSAMGSLVHHKQGPHSAAPLRASSERHESQQGLRQLDSRLRDELACAASTGWKRGGSEQSGHWGLGWKAHCTGCLSAAQGLWGADPSLVGWATSHGPTPGSGREEQGLGAGQNPRCSGSLQCSPSDGPDAASSHPAGCTLG